MKEIKELKKQRNKEILWSRNLKKQRNKEILWWHN